MGRLVMIMFAVLLLTGCKTKYVTVPEIHTEYISKTDTFVQRDSIHEHDSIWSIIKGDTVTNYKYKTIYKDRIVYKAKTDTVLKVDTVTQVVTVTEKVKTPWYEKLGQMVGAVILALLTLAFINYYRGK